jgi:hypothetical protein
MWNQELFAKRDKRNGIDQTDNTEILGLNVWIDTVTLFKLKAGYDWYHTGTRYTKYRVYQIYLRDSLKQSTKHHERNVGDIWINIGDIKDLKTTLTVAVNVVDICN